MRAANIKGGQVVYIHGHGQGHVLRHVLDVWEVRSVTFFVFTRDAFSIVQLVNLCTFVYFFRMHLLGDDFHRSP